MSDTYCICWSLFPCWAGDPPMFLSHPFSIFLAWCVLFNRWTTQRVQSHALMARPTGKRKLWQSIHAWSIVTFPSELQGQCSFTMSSHFVKLNKPCSLNGPSLSQHSNFPRWHPRTYRLCQYADKTAEPLDWETYIALPSLPTCKSRQRQLLCFKQVQPYSLASCTALRTTLYRWLAVASNDNRADSINLFASLAIERDTFAHLQVMTAQTNVLATSEGHQRSVMAGSDQPEIL